MAFLIACSPYQGQHKHKTRLASSDESSQLLQSDYPYSEGDDIPAIAYMHHDETYNAESVIPPQCYTKTEGVNNPCYACHQSYDRSEARPNQMGDGTLQGNYEFSDVGLRNSWKNLFVDRQALIESIPDKDIDLWVDEDNYHQALSAAVTSAQKQEYDFLEAQPLPANMRLANLGNPDIAFSKNGLATDGSFWVAYNYKPFPSTFWPTNGSFGDAMIRLPKDFRNINGKFSEAIYFLNLAAVELAMKDLESVTIYPFNEKAHGIDINGDDLLSESVNRLVKPSHYFGDAKNTSLARMLYPQGSEFLHTVRYLDENEKGDILPSKRMKEVRYMQKHLFRSRESLASAYYAEAKDKHFEQLPQTRYLGERGIDNGFGWTINAFIENKSGELRPQHEQELAYCNGCHKSVGASFDQTFSFVRKAPGIDGWGYIDLASLTDAPNINEELGEYLTYMTRVGGGDEFRQNTEMLDKWFDDDGKIKASEVANTPSLQALIVPSPERARKLNKAYFTIVQEQSYLFGRDATISTAKNVIEKIDTEQAPLLDEHQYKWDMRLDWAHQSGLNLAKEN
ncbi:hypothetical protein ISG33_10740 [Glaciecola sp. MH2013]|nr:hypothetical protein [Glaciecola sp. MH2013]